MNTKEYKRGRTDLQILTKAIEKAIAGGWDKFGLQKYNCLLNEYTDINGNPDIELKFVRGTDACCFTVNDLIFNHKFAKALWPNPPAIKHKEDKSGGYPIQPWPFKFEWWQWHLMQMVIADDPIQYLAEHLDD